MEFLVDFTIVVPDGTADAELQQRVSAESERVAAVISSRETTRPAERISISSKSNSVAVSSTSSSSSHASRVVGFTRMFPITISSASTRCSDSDRRRTALIRASSSSGSKGFGR